jgi:hypothetical protein
MIAISRQVKKYLNRVKFRLDALCRVLITETNLTTADFPGNAAGSCPHGDIRQTKLIARPPPRMALSYDTYIAGASAQSRVVAENTNFAGVLAEGNAFLDE